MTRRPSSAWLTATVAVIVLSVAACTSGGTGSSSTASPTAPGAEIEAFEPVDPDAKVDGPITIGYQDIGSSQVIAEVYAKALEEAAFDVQLTIPAEQADLVDAMAAGVVDVMPAYSGVFANALFKADNYDADPPVWDGPGDAQAAVNRLGSAIGIEMLDPSPANEGAEFVVTKDFSEAHGITTLSQMADWSRTHPLRLGPRRRARRGRTASPTSRRPTACRSRTS